MRLRPEAPARAGAAAPSDFTADAAERLAREELAYRLELQFYVRERETPIEDGSVDWDETVAPFVTVARLTIPKQDPNGDAGRELSARVERAKLDPWGGLAAHRPLGAIMRARSPAYLASQRQRGA